MSTVPRRAGGTTFFRHVHLKAGIEVPRAPLVAYGKERCAPAAPREERGPGAPLAASAARSWPCGLHARMRSRTKVTASGRKGIASRTRVRRGQKPVFQQTIFWDRASVLSHRDAACAGARLSFLLAGVEATSPRTYN